MSYFRGIAFCVPLTLEEWKREEELKADRLNTYLKGFTPAAREKYKHWIDKYIKDNQPSKTRPVNSFIWGPTFSLKEKHKAEAWCQDMIVKRKAQRAQFFTKDLICTCNKKLEWTTKTKNLPSYTF